MEHKHNFAHNSHSFDDSYHSNPSGLHVLLLQGRRGLGDTGKHLLYEQCVSFNLLEKMRCKNG